MRNRSTKRASSTHRGLSSGRSKRSSFFRFSRLSLLAMLTVCCAACGWTLDDPPPYPDLGVGGEEAESTVQTEE